MYKFLLIVLLSACGGETVKYVPAPAPTPSPSPRPKPDGGTINFAQDVQPILTANCALSGCHGSGGFLGSEQAFLNSNGTKRILNGSMPPPYSPKIGQWTEEQKQTILTWYDQNF